MTENETLGWTEKRVSKKNRTNFINTARKRSKENDEMRQDGGVRKRWKHDEQRCWLSTECDKRAEDEASFEHLMAVKEEEPL